MSYYYTPFYLYIIIIIIIIVIIAITMTIDTSHFIISRIITSTTRVIILLVLNRDIEFMS